MMDTGPISGRLSKPFANEFLSWGWPSLEVCRPFRHLAASAQALHDATTAVLAAKKMM
jgi:hypothetical protein